MERRASFGGGVPTGVSGFSVTLQNNRLDSLYPAGVVPESQLQNFGNSGNSAQNDNDGLGQKIFQHCSDAGHNTRGRFALQQGRDSDKLEMCWSASETHKAVSAGRSSLILGGQVFS